MSKEKPKIEDGFVLLARKILENPIFLNAELLQLYIYCLEKANHKPKEHLFNGEMKNIKRGQFITGRHIISTHLKQNPNTIYKRLNLLKKLGYITIESNNKFSLVTLVNYVFYQNAENYKYQPDNNQITTREQPDNTNNKDNNNKKEKIIERENNIYINTNSIVYSDVVLQLQQWNYPSPKEIIETYGLNVVNNAILATKEKKPRDNSAYFHSLLLQFKDIEAPAIRDLSEFKINREEASRLMTQLINTGADIEKEKLRKIIKNDDVDSYKLLVEQIGGNKND